MAEEKMVRSSRVARFASYIIDLLVIVTIRVIISLLFTKLLGGFTIYLINLVTPFLYFWLLTFYWKQTLGKRLFDLKVVSEDGSKASLGKLFVREVIGKIVSSLILGIGYLWILFDAKREGWHDKIAGTRVVEVKPLQGGKKVFAYILTIVFPLLLILAIVLIAVLGVGFAMQLQKANQQKLLQQQYLQQIQYNQTQLPTLPPAAK